MKAEDNNKRFALLKAGKRILYVFGVNPSTATDTHPDPTVRKIIGFAERNGYEGFAIMNLYPLRSTNPYALPKVLDEDLHQRNLIEIKEVFGNNSNPEVLLAFGDSISATPYLKKCLKDIVSMLQPLCPKWMQIGNLTKRGNPRHPSRVAYSLDLQNFDVTNYL